MLRTLCSLSAVAALLATAAGHAATLQPGFQEIPVLSGLDQPTAIRFASNGDVFVAEKPGFVRLYEGVDDVAPDEVVDLRVAVHNFWDRGLLGLAIDPAYPASPYIYVLYAHDAFANGTSPRWGSTDPEASTNDPCPSPPGANDDGCVVYGRLSRIQIDPVSHAGTEQVLIEGAWCSQYPSHSIGDLVFGDDGYLYVSAGDGASFNFADWGQDGDPVNPCDDPPDGIGGPNDGPDAEGGSFRSLDILTPGDPTSLDGAVLRLDVSSGSVQAPPDNPLVGNGVPDDDWIVGIGLRNPFRMNHRPGTTEIWITDVGSELWEELNRLPDPTGDVESFGWPCYEGGSAGSLVQAGFQNQDLCQDVYASQIPAGITTLAPFFSYHHDDQVVPGELCGTGSSSATGVAFYEGINYPSAYDGALFFADASRKCIWTVFADAGGEPDAGNRLPFASNTGGRPVDIRMGLDGNLYYVDFDGGKVFRIEYFVANEPPTAVAAASPTNGLAPLLVQFDGTASSDPEDGTNLLYAWDLDNDGAFDDSGSATPSFSYTQPGAHLVRLQVEDTEGATAIAAVVITVGNTPPVASIDTPSASLQWAVGEQVAFSGQATDPEDGPLPPSSLEWEIILHHCYSPQDCHTHPITALAGVSAGSFQAPDHEVPSFVELKLTATDLLPADWLDPAWTRRRKLLFDNSQQGETLTDFPVLVTLDDTRIDYGEVEAGARDLRFTDAAGQLLDYEIEEWAPGGISRIWVEVPSITGGSTSDYIWMYYGNPAAATGAENPAGVWDNGYAAVWHMHDDWDDSTANANHASPDFVTHVAGAVGDGGSFDGADSILAVVSTPSLEITGQLTLETWVKPADPDRNDPSRLLSKKAGWDAQWGYNFEYHAFDETVTTLGSGDDWGRASGVALDASWHWLSATIDGAVATVYVDGQDATTDATVTPLADDQEDLHLGAASPGVNHWYGGLDEMRISDVARSADWMAAQYLSMTDAFISYGSLAAPATLSYSTSLDLHPRTVDVTFQTLPGGLDLAVGFSSDTAPFTKTLIVGSNNSVTAPSQQEVGGQLHLFGAWSDGGAQSHLFVAPESDAELTAAYLIARHCQDGIDNDGDGLTDWPADPGCRQPLSQSERPACDDGKDNDGDGQTDFPADAQCRYAWYEKESGACGIGFELVLILPPLLALRRRAIRYS